MEILDRSVRIAFERTQRGNGVVLDGFVGLSDVAELDAGAAEGFDKSETGRVSRPPSLPTATTCAVKRLSHPCEARFSSLIGRIATTLAASIHKRSLSRANGFCMENSRKKG